MKNSFATLIESADFRAMPWKNGRGVSLEIAIEPAGASLESENLLWRLSTARINEPGDFSLFPGFDRFLTLVEGRELRLSGAGNMHLRVGDVHHFSGDSSVSAELPEGAVVDLGLIYRRGNVSAEMSVLDFSSKARSFRMDSPHNIFYVISGAFTASCYPGERRFELKPGMALRIYAPRNEAERVLLLEPAKPGAQLAAIEITH